MKPHHTQIDQTRLGGSFTWGAFTRYWLDVVFPPRCANCGRLDTFFCSACQARLDALPLKHLERTLPPFSGLISTEMHRIPLLRRLIHSLKYDNMPELAQPLGIRLATAIQDDNWEIDLVISVPLHPHRQRERGYNQSTELAKVVSEVLGLRELSSALQRTVNTRSQVGLGQQQRLDNVAGAFIANPHHLEGAKVLLIDDVLTTGATMQACAEAVIAAGAHSIYGVTITSAS
ncbi:MAG: ComF family protein [Phototrophicaceae bacterium]